MKFFSILMLLLVWAPQLYSAILWEDSPPPTTKKSRFDYDQTDSARKVGNFWENRKMALNFSMGGVYGLAGGGLGIHFHPQWAFELGYGGGSHFHSFGFRVRGSVLQSSPFNPYYGFGFHRWQRTKTRPYSQNDLAPGFIGSEFLSEEEKRQGRVDEKLLNGTLGLQYIFIEGPWKGIGLSVEAVLLISAEDLQTSPTFALGASYFF